jgi:hypothetical protein
MFYLTGKKFSCQYKILSPAQEGAQTNQPPEANRKEIISSLSFGKARREFANDP